MEDSGREGQRTEKNKNRNKCKNVNPYCEICTYYTMVTSFCVFLEISVQYYS